MPEIPEYCIVCSKPLLTQEEMDRGLCRKHLEMQKIQKEYSWDDILATSLRIPLYNDAKFVLDHEPAEDELTAFHARLHSDPAAIGRKYLVIGLDRVIAIGRMK